MEEREQIYQCGGVKNVLLRSVGLMALKLVVTVVSPGDETVMRYVRLKFLGRINALDL